MTDKPVDVSVVVPAYNAAGTICEQLDALRAQHTTFAFEVIVADNGSTDQTTQVVSEYIERWPSLRLIDASARRGSAHARNVGAKAADGDVLAFCDADDVVEAEWLESIVAPVTASRIVFGTLRVDSINESHVRKWRGTPHAATLTGEGSPKTFAPSGNMAIRRASYLQLGGMDEDYPKSHDVEFSFRARASGMELHPVPEAVVHYRFRATLGGVFHQGFRSGRAAAQLYAQFRHADARRGASTAMRSYWWLVSRTPHLFRRDRRGLWISALGSSCGHLVGSIRYRVLYL